MTSLTTASGLIAFVLLAVRYIHSIMLHPDLGIINGNYSVDLHRRVGRCRTLGCPSRIDAFAEGRGRSARMWNASRAIPQLKSLHASLDDRGLLLAPGSSVAK